LATACAPPASKSKATAAATSLDTLGISKTSPGLSRGFRAAPNARNGTPPVAEWR
jgi:hypothetical protein